MTNQHDLQSAVGFAAIPSPSRVSSSEGTPSSTTSPSFFIQNIIGKDDQSTALSPTSAQIGVYVSSTAKSDESPKETDDGG